ncbi:hypothetical protein AAFC00_006335 [Neodothiora populina]|uniref:Major facilitator superfamily (MFS) profile domain-containing protein n=1 Tax=Neodothiora populina TaxID=2781224 RepID=A0ABR3P510_9PEZI
MTISPHNPSATPLPSDGVPSSTAQSDVTTPSSSNSSRLVESSYVTNESKKYNDDDDDDDEERTKLYDSNTANPTSQPTNNVLPIDEDEQVRRAGTALHPISTSQLDPGGPVSWMSLPRKDQLAILTLARLSEPLTQTSLQSYMFYQLRSLSPDASDSKISNQAGLLQAAFTGAQFCTAILWGRMADSERMGRKRVILIGLLGTAIGAVGFGFSRSFAAALCWRCLGGALNGNIGVMRTMISEIIREKKFQSRAFLLLPMTFNIGVIIGPILGGLLADPISSYPGLFGPHSSFGGQDGVWWMRQWPYALPNLVSAVFLVCSATALFLGLEESLVALRDRPDWGIRFSRWVARAVFHKRDVRGYAAVSTVDEQGGNVEMACPPTPQTPQTSSSSTPLVRQKLPFRRIWTPNVLFTLMAHGLLACHVGTFTSLFFMFMSTTRETDPNESLHLPPGYTPHLPFTFTGGLALPPPKIGSALAILGVIGISLQLMLYPRLSFRLGTVLSFRLALCLFPLAYTLVPFLALVPSSTSPPDPAAGPWLWLALTVVLFVQVLARTFALPATAILVNNASPHPSVLGTIHGVGQSVSSAMRTIGPVVLSWLYGLGLSHGYVGLAWWCMAGWAVMGALASGWVREGDGHEIWLEGEEDEDKVRGN